jgi:hypothetical protein
MKTTRYSILILFAMIGLESQAQDELEMLLADSEVKTKEFVTGTFKGIRVINLHSVEKVAPGALQFLISHRFGVIKGGPGQLWGLDQSTIRFGFEYGIAKWLMIGAGRSSYEKNYDGFVKFSLVRQSTGARGFPFSILYFGSIVNNGMPWANPDRTNYYSSRLTFVNQVIVGCKINERLSVQVVPSEVFRNFVDTPKDDNVVYAIGFAGRYKMSKRVSLNSEWIYRLPQENALAVSYAAYYNSFSVGFDIETGGHVFQLHLTNSLSMIEKGFITETSESWKKGGIHFGFNVSRDFSVKRKKNG